MDDSLIAALDLAIASGRDFHGLPLVQLRAALRQDSSGGRDCQYTGSWCSRNWCKQRNECQALAAPQERKRKALASRAEPGAPINAAKQSITTETSREVSAGSPGPASAAPDEFLASDVNYRRGLAEGLEEAAKVCDEEWIRTSSLCRSSCAGDLARSIRAKIKPAKGEEICERCKGSGETKGMTYGRGPDDYEIDTPCPACNGTGIKPRTDEGEGK